jgi:hypothetical protein
VLSDPTGRITLSSFTHLKVKSLRGELPTLFIVNFKESSLPGTKTDLSM